MAFCGFHLAIHKSVLLIFKSSLLIYGIECLAMSLYKFGCNYLPGDFVLFLWYT